MSGPNGCARLNDQIQFKFAKSKARTTAVLGGKNVNAVAQLDMPFI